MEPLCRKDGKGGESEEYYLLYQLPSFPSLSFLNHGDNRGNHGPSTIHIFEHPSSIGLANIQSSSFPSFLFNFLQCFHSLFYLPFPPPYPKIQTIQTQTHPNHLHSFFKGKRIFSETQVVWFTVVLVILGGGWRK